MSSPDKPEARDLQYKASYVICGGLQNSRKVDYLQFTGTDSPSEHQVALFFAELADLVQP
jgi:hypothetical protein